MFYYWTDESHDEVSSDENREVPETQRMPRPTHSIMEQFDTQLRQIELQLKRSQEKNRAKRDKIFKELDTRCFQCGQTGHFKNECKS